MTLTSAVETMSTPALVCQDLEVTLHGASGANTVLRGVDVDISPGEFVSIVGTSGTGKTTLLRVLAGLQRPSDGRALKSGAQIDGCPEGVVTVFQNYANSLLPWRSVARNVALGIEGKVTKQECAERVEAALEMVGLSGSAREYPWRLSGGMQQRVQLARAIAVRPSILLMDEPFGALDAMTKAGLQDQLQRIQEDTNTTIVFVTHDIDEAVYLSDRVLVLAGHPASVYRSVEIDLPRPREQVGTKETPTYLAARHAIYEALGYVTAPSKFS